VEAAAFLALKGAADDQVGCHDEVAQLDQVVADTEIAVELVDFTSQQADPVLRPLQALVGADDAHVIPHEAAQLFPVVGDHDRFVGVGHAAFVPLGQRCRQFRGLARMSAAAASPNTRHSRSELLARRLAPWRPVQAVSPIAWRPATSVRALRSVTIPPQENAPPERPESAAA
jgi:hypothetical protein